MKEEEKRRGREGRTDGRTERGKGRYKWTMISEVLLGIQSAYYITLRKIAARSTHVKSVNKKIVALGFFNIYNLI